MEPLANKKLKFLSLSNRWRFKCNFHYKDEKYLEMSKLNDLK
jgi:hypothetical protein